MKSNRLAVLAASLQCPDEVKVVARGTPRSRTSVTSGIQHLLKLIDRTHSPAQARAEEREERLIRISGIYNLERVQRLAARLVRDLHRVPYEGTSLPFLRLSPQQTPTNKFPRSPISETWGLPLTRLSPRQCTAEKLRIQFLMVPRSFRELSKATFIALYCAVETSNVCHIRKGFANSTSYR